MVLGLYKPGQGYWVRVLTATLLGVATLATSAWVWSQAALVVASLPRSAVEVTLKNVEGASPAVGSRVDLLAPPAAGATGQPRVLGSAEVAAYDLANGSMRLRGVQITEPAADASMATAVSSPGGAGSGFSGDVSGTARAVAAIDPLYIQGGAAALVLLLGALFTYYLVASRPSSVEFLIATDGEMKKVNWSTRKDIIGSTGVVIFACFFISALLFAFDLIFKIVFQGIGVLVD